MRYMKKENTIANLVKTARKKKGYSARKLAELCNISHTEVSNIEKGLRVKPAILTLKGFEKYLDLPFEKIAKLAGYSDVTIDFTEENIIVSYEKYDKKVREFQEIEKRLLHEIERRRHMAIDTNVDYHFVLAYLKSLKNVDEKILHKAELVRKYLNEMSKEMDQYWVDMYRKL